MEASFHLPQRGRRANTLLMVLLTIAVLSVVAGNLVWSASARYHTTYQSASWQESLVAAEAGVNLAMVELRKRARGGDSNAFVPPSKGGFWLSGNNDNTDPKSQPTITTPADKRFLGGAVDPTKVTSYYDPASDPKLLHPISMADTYPENGHALRLGPVGTHSGEGNLQTWARVYVDVPGSPAPPSTMGTNFAATPPASIDDFMNEQNDSAGYDTRSHWWYRIRSVGVAGVSGPPRPSADSRDNLLRRFSFFTDWRSNQPVDAKQGPQVSRAVEVVVRPLTGFRNALMADKRIDLQGETVLVDSYNSTYGLYGSTYVLPSDNKVYTNSGTMGNIATNGSLINAGGAIVKGDAMTDDGVVRDGKQITGTQSADFYQELLEVPAPAPSPATVFTLDGKTLNNKPGAGTSGNITFDGAGNYQITAGPTRATYTRTYLNGINLSGTSASTVEIKGAADGSDTYAKIIVNGDINTNSAANPGGSSAIIIDNGVHAIVYVTGNVSLYGAGVSNMAQSADRLLINGVQPASGSTATPSINIWTTQDFQGVIYAPDHDLNLALQAVTTNSDGTVTTPASKLSKTVKDQIKALNDQIKNLNDNIDNVNKDIQNLQKDMAQNPSNTVVDNQRIAQDQLQITGYGNQITGLQSQISVLQGNVLPDTTPQMNDHANGYNGVYGGFVARTITVGSKTHVHYDEALRQAGPVNHYTITNWYEDNASHSPN